VKLLFLAHRVPWPPDKGDRVRSHGILEWLAARHEVHVGAFADTGDVDEARRAQEALRSICADVHVVPRPPLARGLLAAVTGRPISFEIFASRRLDRWVAQTMKRVGPDAAFGFSGQMAPPLLRLSGLPRVLDLVDVDSEKWRSRYARSHNTIHLIEANRVRRFEDLCVRELDAVLLTSAREAPLLGTPADGVHVIRNGVDFDHFRARSEDPGGTEIGFVGAMDYEPNAQGVLWFVREVLPRVRERVPQARLTVVGRRPPQELTDAPDVRVTGWVDDLRPILGRATLAIVPIRAAHGVQSKALTGMALGLPTVITSEAAGGIQVRHEEHALVARNAEDFADAVVRLLESPQDRIRLAAAGRAFVESRHDWERNLPFLERLLSGEAVPDDEIRRNAS